MWKVALCAFTSAKTPVFGHKKILSATIGKSMMELSFKTTALL